jgi:hypothetical protein
LAGLRVRRFDPIAEASELPNHSPRALISGSFGDCWAPFVVTGSLMEDQPEQTTLSMRNDPDGLIMSEARDATAIDDNDAQLFAQTRTLRIRQMDGLELSTDKRDLAAPAVAILP